MGQTLEACAEEDCKEIHVSRGSMAFIDFN